MKNVIKSVAISMIMAVVFNSCSGGSGAPKVKDNPLFGNALSIIASYKYEQGKLREKRDKEYDNASSLEDLGNAQKKYEKKMQELNSKYEQKAEAESNKIAGTEIPYVISDGLQYTIEGPVTAKSVWISDFMSCGVSVSFNIRIMKNLTRIDRAYVVGMAGDKPLAANMEFFLSQNSGKVNIGDVVPVIVSFSFSGDLNNWSDFNFIKFISAAEWYPIYNELEK